MKVTYHEPGENLLDSGCDVLVNATNTEGIMGGGIAFAFRERFPDMFREYRRRALSGNLIAGVIDIHDILDGVHDDVESRYVANLHTKDLVRNDSRYTFVVEGLMTLIDWLREEDVDGGLSLVRRTVAVPALGCGLGGLEWAVVEPLILDAFQDWTREDGELHVYRPWEGVVTGA